MVFLSAEQGRKAPEIAAIVRESEVSVQRWLKGYLAEGVEGLKDAPRPGRTAKVTDAYRTELLAAVRRRPRSLEQPYSLWTLQRLADYLAEKTGLRVSDETVRQELKKAEIVLSRPQHKISSPAPEYLVKKAIEDTRDHLKPGEVFYYADEFNVSWLPTLRALWGPKGQQVMIPTPGQPHKRYGLGAVNYHTGETVVLFRSRKRRPEVAELLQALVDKHPIGTIYVAWDNADTHEDDQVEAVVRRGRRALWATLPAHLNSSQQGAIVPSREQTINDAVRIFGGANYPSGLSKLSAWLGIYQSLLWYEPVNHLGYMELH